MQIITAIYKLTNTPQTFTETEWAIKQNQLDVNGNLAYQFVSIEEEKPKPQPQTNTQKAPKSTSGGCSRCNRNKKK